LSTSLSAYWNRRNPKALHNVDHLIVRHTKVNFYSPIVSSTSNVKHEKPRAGAGHPASYLRSLRVFITIDIVKGFAVQESKHIVFINHIPVKDITTNSYD